MKANEIRKKNQAQLSDDLIHLRKEQLSLRFQRANGTAKNTARFRVVRRDIARIKTILAEMKQQVS